MNTVHRMFYVVRNKIGNTVKCTLCDAQLTFCGGTTNMINQVICSTSLI